MAIDTSMYNQNPVNSGLDALSNTLKLSDMVRQSKERQATKAAFANNTTQDESGNPQINQAGVLSDLYKANPQMAMEYQTNLAQQKKAAQESQIAQLNLHSAQLGMVGNIASGIKDQSSYEQGIKTLQSNGIDVSDAPAQFDPNWVRFHAGMALTAKDRIENHLKQQEADAKTLESHAKAAEAGIPYGGSGGGTGAGAGNTLASNGPGGAMGKPDQLSDQDPADLLKRVPMKDRQKVAEEIKDQSNIVNVGQKSLDDFDRAATEVRPFTGGRSTSGTAFVPGMESAGQKAFLGGAFTTVKGVEGSVRQAQFDAIKSKFMPEFGDSDATIASKRASWTDYLKSHSSSPLAKAYGIDLTKYKKTYLPDDLGKDTAGDMATVQLPDGRTGSIPRSNLSKAVSMGAKEIK